VSFSSLALVGVYVGIDVGSSRGVRSVASSLSVVNVMGLIVEGLTVGMVRSTGE